MQQQILIVKETEYSGGQVLNASLEHSICSDMVKKKKKKKTV